MYQTRTMTFEGKCCEVHVRKIVGLVELIMPKTSLPPYLF